MKDFLEQGITDIEGKFGRWSWSLYKVNEVVVIDGKNDFSQRVGRKDC